MDLFKTEPLAGNIICAHPMPLPQHEFSLSGAKNSEGFLVEYPIHSLYNKLLHSTVLRAQFCMAQATEH